MYLVNLTVIYIFIIRTSLSTVAGNIKWTLKENPAIFGTDIHLVCHLPKDASCCKDGRKWNVGNQYELITVDDLVHNTSKYKEDLNVKERVSVLTVFALSEQDVNIPYECVYGFQKYRSVLELTEDVFEFHPTERLPAIVPEIRRYHIIFNMLFKKVFPKPLCRAALGMQNVSSFLVVTVRRNGLFYESVLTFNYSGSDSACPDSILVLCTVGTTVLTVVDYKICSSPEARDVELNTSEVIAIFFVSTFILILFPVIVFLKKAILTRLKQHKDKKTAKEHISLQSPMNNQPLL